MSKFRRMRADAFKAPPNPLSKAGRRSSAFKIYRQAPAKNYLRTPMWWRRRFFTNGSSPKCCFTRSRVQASYSGTPLF